MRVFAKLQLKIFGCKKRRKKKIDTPEKIDPYKKYRSMTREELEEEVCKKKLEIQRIKVSSENLDNFYRKFNLEKEVQFFIRLQTNPNELAPALFEL